jgi:hypothetical protein
MTRFDLSTLDACFGWKADPGKAYPDLFSALTELQNIKLAVVSGVATGTGMTVSGVTVSGSTILSAVEVRRDADTAPISRTASTYVSSADTIACNESINTSARLFVLWMNKSYQKPAGQ